MKKNPRPKNPQGEREMREALRLELHTEMSVPTGQKTKRGRDKMIRIKKLRLVQRALVNAAIKGDVPAIKEINDRMDGRVVQQIQGPGKDGAIPLQFSNLTNEQLKSLIARLEAGGL